MTTFQQFLTQDQEVLAAIKAFGRSFQMGSDEWSFSLPDLHTFIQARFSNIEMPYTKFRQSLFQLPTNNQLLDWEATVILIHSTGKVDSNLYQLRKLTDPVVPE